LELESKVSVNESPWPLSSIIVMSIDLAKRDDMASNLSKVAWDLIIFDESHLLSGGKRKALFNRLRESGAARRGLFLSATPTFVDNVITKLTTWDWDVRDWDGQPLFPPFERKLTSVYYQRTNEERDFLNQLQDFTGSLTNSFPYGNLLGISILRAASSSSYAIEAMLRGLLNGWSHMRNKIAHNVPWTGEDLENVQRRFSLAADESGVVEEMPEKITIRPQEFLTLYQKLEWLLDRIDEISTDSKLETLISHTREFFDLNKKLHLCIWCTFAKTVNYVSSSLQDLEKPVLSLTGALELAERMYRLEAFRNDGGILIVTDAASEGGALECVDECINYDLPLNRDILEQRWGRFLRLGRKTEFRMVFLRDRSKSLVWEEELLIALTASDTSGGFGS